MIRKSLLMTTFCLTISIAIASTANAQINEQEVKVIPEIQILGTISNDIIEMNETILAMNNNILEVSNLEEDKTYADLGMSIAESYLNIRKKPSEDSEILGKLYQGCVATILSENDEWVKITSNGVEGYAKKEYLAIGNDAKLLFDQYAKLVATTQTETLKVRENESVDSACVGLVPGGSTYEVLSQGDEWSKISFEGMKGYVSNEYLEFSYEFEYAISMEEELANLAAEQAAKEAEEKAAQAAKKAEEAAKKVAQTTKKSTTKSASTTNKTTSSQTTSGSSNVSSSSTGSRVASYAKQFVGNPYVWGGTSLTNGTDCSGFVQSVYKKFGYSLPRTSRQQAVAGRGVSEGNLQPGDIISYAKNGTVNHVAIYIGNGKVVHASNPKDGIKISSYNYRAIYSIRRII